MDELNERFRLTVEKFLEKKNWFPIWIIIIIVLAQGHLMSIQAMLWISQMQHNKCCRKAIIIHIGEGIEILDAQLFVLEYNGWKMISNLLTKKKRA